MRDTRINIEFTQGDDWEQVVLFRDLEGAAVDMSEYTFEVDLKQVIDDAWPELGPIAVNDDESSDGRLVFTLNNQTSVTGHEKLVWRVRAFHTSGFDWTIWWGEARAWKFRSAAAQPQRIITIDGPNVIQVTIGGLVGPSGSGSFPNNRQVFVATGTWVRPAGVNGTSMTLIRYIGGDLGGEAGVEERWIRTLDMEATLLVSIGGEGQPGYCEVITFP